MAGTGSGRRGLSLAPVLALGLGALGLGPLPRGVPSAPPRSAEGPPPPGIPQILRGVREAMGDMRAQHAELRRLERLARSYPRGLRLGCIGERREIADFLMGAAEARLTGVLDGLRDGDRGAAWHHTRMLAALGARLLPLPAEMARCLEEEPVELGSAQVDTAVDPRIRSDDPSAAPPVAVEPPPRPPEAPSYR